MTKAMTWVVRAAVLVTIAWPLVGEAGTLELPGTSWSLSGKARVSGVAKQGRRSRPFGDSNRVQMTANFGTGFYAHDFAGWDYFGSYEQRGRTGATVKLTLDGPSEVEFATMIQTWLSSLSGETVNASVRAAPLTAVIRGSKATLTGTRRISASSASATARGSWTIRLSGRRT